MTQGNYHRYYILNSGYRVIDGAETIGEARDIVRAYMAEDFMQGINSDCINYHIERHDERTGKFIRSIQTFPTVSYKGYKIRYNLYKNSWRIYDKTYFASPLFSDANSVSQAKEMIDSKEA